MIFGRLEGAMKWDWEDIFKTITEKKGLLVFLQPSRGLGRNTVFCWLCHCPYLCLLGTFWSDRQWGGFSLLGGLKEKQIKGLCRKTAYDGKSEFNRQHVRGQWTLIGK